MKTKYDWLNVPKEVKFIATDYSGLVNGFNKSPISGVLSWHYGCNIGLMFSVDVKPYEGNWQDSLEERPK